MDYLLFYKINNYYAFLDTQLFHERDVSQRSLAPTFFHETNFADLRDGQVVDNNYLSQKNILDCALLHPLYYVIKQEDTLPQYIIFCPFKKSSIPLFSLRRKANSSEVNTLAQRVILSFRLAKRDQLFATILEDAVDLATCIRAFSDYTFFQRFVFWVYNPHTNFFCCMASSHPIPVKFVNDSSNSSLHGFLKSSSVFESRAPIPDPINEKFVSGMKVLNRMRLDFRNEECGVLDLLSVYPGFSLRDKTRVWIKTFLETKYLEVSQNFQVALLNVEKYFSQYIPGQFDRFLYGLTQTICGELNFQACSIFIKDPSGKKLILKAVTDNERSGRPEKSIEYDLSKRTLTGSVFRTGQISFSYDLSNDPKNSHTFDETTRGKGNTWIGLPLMVNDSTWGVLRVKDKHAPEDKSKLLNLQPGDFTALKAVSTHLSNIYALENEHQGYAGKIRDLEEKKASLDKSIGELKNFYNVFLHEIRTPISTFITSVLYIRKILQQATMEEEIKRSIRNKVNDIGIMGERLKFIANTYYFSELVESGKPENLAVLHDIVLPVLNISQEYIKRQYDVDITLLDDTFKGVNVYGDRTLLNIVFNAIISNAGKYSPRSKEPIEILGEFDRTGNYFYIVISNFGFPINESEKELVFDNSYRGEEPRKQKIGGTGIGLYLAKKIMENQDGDLLLTSLSNPVTFKIKIPVSIR